MEHPTVFPTIRYDDAQAAIDFLVAAFGAEPHVVYTSEDGAIQHAEVRLGNGIVMVGPSRPGAPATGGSGGGIYVVVEDVDEHCARARRGGAEIVHEPRHTDYGSRDYTVRDPEGSTWYFGTFQPFAYNSLETAGAAA